MEHVVYRFLKSLKIPVSRRYVENLILSHPDYPSLLSIADTFERLGINYCASKIKKEQLNNTAFPYLLPISSGQEEIIFIEKEADLNKNEKQLHHWDGVIFQAEATHTINDKENNLIYSRENIFKGLSIILVCVFGTLLILPFINTFRWINIILLSTSGGGSLVGYSLVTRDLGLKNRVIEALCHAGKNTNCDKILNSEYSRVWGIIKFSDLTLSYFVVQSILFSLLTAMPATAPSILCFLSSMSLLTIPTILFSIYYQYYKARTWCKLCLIINFILIAQASLFAYQIIKNPIQLNNISALTLLFSLLIFVAISTTLLLVKGNIERINKAEQEGAKSSRLKNSLSVFTYLLFKQRTIDATPFKAELLIGNPDAPIKIIMASNLYCNPCKEQHEKASQLIAYFPDKVNLGIRFLLSSRDINRIPTTNQYIIQYWKQNFYGKNEQSANTENLLHDWFLTMDFEKFKKKYPLDYSSVDDESKQLENLHFNWISHSRVTQTPAFFINGYELPKEYSLEDLMFLVPGLTDHLNQIK